jgi:hypothetical protein
MNEQLVFCNSKGRFNGVPFVYKSSVTSARQINIETIFVRAGANCTVNITLTLIHICGL